MTTIVYGRIPPSHLTGPILPGLALSLVEGKQVDIGYFIKRWEGTEAAERANKDSFLKELCQVLAVPEPDGKTGDPDRDVYVFEADALLRHEDGRETIGSMDLYRKDCFVLEAKQGSTKKGKKVGTARRGTPGWSAAMNEAMGQAIRYARTLDEPPPFLMVTDLGYCFDLYASFDGTGAYRPFPNGQKNRLFFTELSKHTDLLRVIWLDPHSLDPSRRSEKVTKEVAEKLAHLATELEKDGHPSIKVASFLMRCIFTMFAEDIGLLRDQLFTKALKETWLSEPESFKEGVEALWDAMNEGKRFFILGKLLHFNGGLFAEPEALDLNKKQLKILLAAAEREWSEVEPAIFGTLIEHALNPKERDKLGAYFTPKSYVERLLIPTIEEPLRADWDIVRVQVRQLVPPGEASKPANVKKARALVQDFHKRLCETIVLDPACGSGNFLYLALNIFKRIESEVLATLYDFGVTQMTLGDDMMVTPRQFRGIEIRRESKEIAELVLWIGYLQWHHRMYGQTKHPPEPILRDYKNVEHRDALIDSSNGTANMASWPASTFIVGNPPFIGNKRMRAVLGDEYVDTVRTTYAGVPNSADYVMYWWERAAQLVESGDCQRFGFITTSSVTQSYNNAVIAGHVASGLRLTFAIPNHPWVDSGGSADVRIAMTVADIGVGDGELWRVEHEDVSQDKKEIRFSVQCGPIHPDLTLDVNATELHTLRSNSGLSFMGVTLCGQGFVVNEADEEDPLSSVSSPHLKPYIIGRDLTGRSTLRSVIDFFGLTAREAREQAPGLYQRVLDRVKPSRDQQRRKAYREKWWVFAEARQSMRAALGDLPRFIATCRTATHRVFTFVPSDTIVESTIVAIALDDAFSLGVLSSKLHVTWATRVGTRLGIGNDPRYNNTRCFQTFPFPACNQPTRNQIADAALAVDGHRKRQLERHPKLTVTMLYNVLSRIRNGDPLSDAEHHVYDIGLVGVLRELHDELDELVTQAYGWPSDVEEQEILTRLAALNADRASEESDGSVTWLRPEYQGRLRQRATAPKRIAASDQQLQLLWPTELPQQVAVVRDLMASTNDALLVQEVASAYKGATVKKVRPALETLEALGMAASYKNGNVRWKGLARASGERTVGPGISRVASRPPPADEKTG